MASAAQNPPTKSVLGGFMERFRNDPVQIILYLCGGMVFAVMLLAILSNLLSGKVTLEDIVQSMIFGLAQGSIYALIALGYTLVYGVLMMINFAHGEVFMSGAYIAFFAIYAMEQSGFLAEQPLIALLLTIGIGMIASIVVAVLLERIAYRPLRNAPRLVPLITAIGASIVIRELFIRLFGARPRNYPEVSLFAFPEFFRLECSVVDGVETCLGIDLIRGAYDITLLGMELRVRPVYFIVFILALILMAMLWFIVQRTKVGRAMRAVAEDKKTAALMGVNVDRVIVITFVLGAALAGAAAVLFALYNQRVMPEMGFTPGIKAFTAAVLGGIGNIPGAMAGGLLLGIIESVAPSMLGLPTQLEGVISFGVLVLILIFRPTGIFGEVLAKKRA